MIFGNKGTNAAGRAPQMAPTILDHLLTGIQSRVNQGGSRLAEQNVARAAISMESIDSAMQNELTTTANNLSVALEGIAHALPGAPKYQKSQYDAAVAAGIMASDIQAFIHAPTVMANQVSTESMKFVNLNNLGTPDVFSSRMKVALEAYDEKENKNAVTYSVAYNMQAARQDAFGEMFFPTVVVTPDQVGFAISIRLISVYDEQRRAISGDYDNFGKRNIIEAVIDPTILRNDQTKIVPIFRNESKKYFVDEALLAPRDVLVGKESVSTSALKMGATFSLLGISQTEALLETGLLDSTDSIDTAISLTKLFVKLPGATADKDELFEFSTDRLPLATFTYAVQGNYRMMNLAFSTESLLVNSKLKQADGAVSLLLAAITTGEYSVRLGIKVSGSVNLELAETNLFAGGIVVQRVTDKDGVVLDLTTGQGKVIADLFANASAVGYDLSAQRTNLNRRERGQLLDTTFYSQVYTIPLRSPITIPRPLTMGDANDASDLAALITATHIRTSNAAVDELLRVQAVLADYVDTSDTIGNSPEIMGVAHYLLKAFYEHDDLDVSTVIDSIKSHERAADTQAVLVNKIRDMAFRMYRDSGYKAAADALAGGVAPIPTVILGTDPVIARYLQISGDLRTLGGGLDLRIESTLNQKMAGKIIMSFGVFSEGQDGVPNPMHFGNMGWKPELTLVLPLHRNGANSKELTVQPSFLHITHLPIMASLNVSGIPDVMSEKIAVNMHSVP